jgi:hypothetical protein
MKIRQGFVSNSSSSSFAFLGREIKFGSINFPHDGKLPFQYFAIGHPECFENGADVFKLSPDIVKCITDNKMTSRFRFYEVYANEGQTITRNTIPDDVEVEVFGGECDQNSTSTLREFKEFYLESYDDYEDDENE